VGKHREEHDNILAAVQRHGTAGPPGTGATDSINALAALYQGEKTDASYIFNTAMAMMGLAVAYLIGAIPFVTSLGHGPMGWLFVLLLPTPLWLVVSFHSLITLNGMSHGISVRIIEDRLFEISSLGEGLGHEGKRALRQWVGSAAGDRIMDITRSSPIHKGITVVVYGGVACLVVGFTLYALHSANGVLEEVLPALSRKRLLGIAGGFYALLLIMALASWWKGFEILAEGGHTIPKPKG
jgi:hypothetical protein